MRLDFAWDLVSASFFWLDRWIGDRSLAIQYLSLFTCARNKESKVQDYLERVGSQVVWGPTLRRNLTKAEEAQLIILNSLQNVQTHEEEEDGRVWVASRDNLFSVSTFFVSISRSDRAECK